MARFHVCSAEFDRLTERARFLSAVDEGLEDEREGWLVSHEEVVAEMRRRAASRRTASPDAPTG